MRLLPGGVLFCAEIKAYGEGTAPCRGDSLKYKTAAAVGNSSLPLRLFLDDAVFLFVSN